MYNILDIEIIDHQLFFLRKELFRAYFPEKEEILNEIRYLEHERIRVESYLLNEGKKTWQK